ncbi:MAG: ABC transporter ATP-binding protein [Promethearchaeati archaeon SRVP18_Atabeyarchaeia-1]
MPSIRVANLTKRFGKFVALDKVDFHVKNGEYIGILGPSGCGKTTLIKCIAGILKQDKGHVYIGEKLVDGMPPEDRGIGYVFQNIALFPHMNVRENIGYGLRVRQVDAEESRRLVSEMIALIRFSADSHSFPRELSGGMQQKVAVARALASRTELLLLDEPLSALDALVRVELRYELKKIVKELKLTAIHITHDQEEVMSVADRIIIMKKGQVVEVGAPDQLYFEPNTLFTANFLGEANFIECKIAETEDNTVTLRLRSGQLIKAHLKEQDRGEVETDLEAGSAKKREKRPKNSFAANMLVVAAVRPEFVLLSEAGGAHTREKANTLPARITKTIFSGASIRCELTLDGGDHIMSRIPIDKSWEELRIGEDVSVTLDANSILVYPYPRIGLEREISLE